MVDLFLILVRWRLVFCYFIDDLKKLLFWLSTNMRGTVKCIPQLLSISIFCSVSASNNHMILQFYSGQLSQVMHSLVSLSTIDRKKQNEQ